MSLSAHTLSLLRRAATGAAVVAASGVALAAGPGSAAEPSPSPATTGEPAATAEAPVPGPSSFDPGDCPACGLG